MKKNVNIMQYSEESRKMGNFYRFWVGQLFSLLGSELVDFIIIWEIMIISRDASLVVLALLLKFAPSVIIGPISGVLADRLKRKPLIAGVDFLQTCTTATLIFLSMHLTNAWILILFNMIRAMFQAVQRPAVSALIPQLVPREKLSRINGLNGFFASIIGIIGPLLAAFLLKIWSFHQILLIDILTFGIAIICILSVKLSINKHSTKEKECKSSFQQDFVAGLRTFGEIPALLLIVIFMIVTNFFLCPFNTLISFVITIVHTGSAQELAFLSICLNMGMIGGSILISIKKEWKYKAEMIFIALMMVFIGTFIISIAPYRQFWVIAIGGLLTCICIPIFQTLVITLIQTTISHEKMGRVSSIVGALNSMSLIIGYLLTALIANFLDSIVIITASSILGCISIIIISIWGNLRQLNKIVSENLKQITSIIESTQDSIKNEQIPNANSILD